MLFLSSLLPQVQELASQIDWVSLVRTALIFSAVAFAAGSVLRVFLGRGSNITRAVSASLSVLMIYLAAILIYLFLPDYRAELASLPFITVDEQRLVLWELTGLSEELLYGSILRLALLAFLVNLLEALLPQGEKFFTWYLWRCVTVLAGLVVYRFCCALLDQFLPQVMDQWAKAVVLGFWTLILMSGILKLLLSIVLTVINPIVGALYTFFFSNLLGRQFSKSILTTLILVGLVGVLNQMGFSQFAFGEFSLLGYGPTCIILVATLYLFGRFL